MSGLTKTYIANAALGHIGKAPITDYDESSPEAVIVRNNWDLTRDEMLRVKEWPFSKRRAVLTPLADAPLFGYAYAYGLPENYLRVLEFNGIPAGTGQTNFEIEGASLLTNGRCGVVNLVPGAPAANLRYIARIETVSLWDASFCNAFTYMLAAAVAPSISSAPGLGLTLRQKGEALVAQAFGPANNESRPRAVMATCDSGWMRARLNGNGGVGYLANVPWGMVADACGVWQNCEC